MTGEDLEVRSRALNYLFETVMKYGGDFPLDFWDILWRQLLYPIFMVLRSKSEMSKVVVHEELSVWLSTTMVQALRNMITLFTHFFESLEYMLDRFLDLLILCICQENDTLARIGSNCLQQLILQNDMKFSEEDWHKIVNAFVDLFARTEATALFSAATSATFTSRMASMNGNGPRSPQPDAQSFDNLSLSSMPLDTPTTEISDPTLGLGINTSSLDKPRADWGSMGPSSQDPSGPPSPQDDESTLANSEQIKSPTGAQELESYRPTSSQQSTPVVVTAARRRFFNQIITKCVLTLLMIETVNELLSNDNVYAQMPSTELLRLMALLKKSYHFARKFNHDRELRTRLFKEGFMKQPPNLLKQESGAAATYVAILIRMYHDPNPARVGSRAQTETALVPLCVDILKSYLDLDDETQSRNIATWRPVVVDVLDGYAGFERDEFEKHLALFAPLVVGLLGREMSPEFQGALQRVVARLVDVTAGVDCSGWLIPGDGRGSSRRPSLKSGK
jgi:brefeldin A-inhibited guanine nucleotide-exchange protein